MKLFLLLLSSIFIYSCTPLVRKIDDRIRNEVTYLWDVQKNSRSKINRVYRSFYFTVKKKESDEEYVYFNVTSSFPITHADYFDTAYIVLPNQSQSFLFVKTFQNIHYKEKIDEVSTTTNTKTKVDVESTTSTEQKDRGNRGSQTQEVTTDTKTTTSTTTDTDTQVNSEILDKVKSERQIKVRKNVLQNALRASSIKFRFYSDRDDDFWDIVFTQDDVKKMNQLINNKADTNY